MAATRSTRSTGGATGIRLQKILSQGGVCSRREAETLILQGRVDVNGEVVSTLGTRADPAIDDVRVDGRRVGAAPERRYLLMNKPRGVVSTRSDPHQRRTVVDLLTKQGIRGYFYPVGRLDFESEGLIILTNDGTFAQRVTHPSYEMEREYEAQIQGVPDERDLNRLRRGIEIDGRRTLPAQVRIKRVVKGRRGTQAVLEVVLREGRNRQVRYMCDAIAHPVERLRRIRIGHIVDAALKPGQVRDLTPREVQRLLTAEPRPPKTVTGTTSRPRPRTKPKTRTKPETKPTAQMKPETQTPAPRKAPKPGARAEARPTTSSPAHRSRTARRPRRR